MPCSREGTKKFHPSRMQKNEGLLCHLKGRKRKYTGMITKMWSLADTSNGAHKEQSVELIKIRHPDGHQQASDFISLRAGQRDLALSAARIVKLQSSDDPMVHRNTAIYSRRQIMEKIC
jgi:hypothetical protein